MKVGLLQEAELMPGMDVATRYMDMIEEVALADRLGFSCWGTSEQHFSPPRFAVAAPEVLYAAVAQNTENIRLRVMCAVLLSWNHPILVAERLATLDIVSKGRAELATARSNNVHTMEAFGVDPKTTREQWADGIEVIAKAFTDDVLEHDGPIWKIPPREIMPKPVQKPHPPLSVAASSVASHVVAGERGIGALCFESYFGFEYLQECIDGYRQGLSKGTQMAPRRTEHMGLYVATAYCAETREEACRIAYDVAMGYYQFLVDIYVPLGKQGSYEYLDDKLQRLIDHRDDFDYLLTQTPSIMIGTPEDFVERIQRLEEMGIDEILMRIDGVAHADIMRSFELIGREVIPKVSAKVEAA
ncbi:MAG: LLM class flavin-dependent oxidoreductase [Rhodospirillaceae bacterium]|nr:LLM class flavin-dependent oxidoreductase [Rhodospirillaceae bacterium]|tara:strand:- start:6688 stop:7761 length:1074 start_codon:yes stop_codon:yes gene_type:complete